MFRKHPLITLAMMILIASIGLIACSPSASSTPTAASAPTTEPTTAISETTEAVSVSTDAVTCTLLNLNDVTEDALLNTIPDFSNRMVREFFEYRPYVSIQEFRREIGKYVDDATIAGYEQYVYVPVTPNESDADTLMQIPGVDETLANTLIQGRPYASNQAFLDALAESLTAEQVAQASCYLAAE